MIKSPKKTVLIIIVVLIAVATTTTSTVYFLFNKYQQKRQLNQVELAQVSQKIKQQQIKTKLNPTQNTYHLLEGWNFVSFPFKPQFTSASEMIKHITINDGYVTTISRWDGDRWQEFSQRGSNQYGHDFEIKPLTAYFIKNHQETDWLVAGTPLVDSNPTYELKTGWNILGITQPNLTASKVIDQINQDQAKENATVMDWWSSGNWDLYIKRHYKETDVREYGTDFEIKNTRGYMILLNRPTTWRP